MVDSAIAGCHNDSGKFQALVFQLQKEEQLK